MTTDQEKQLEEESKQEEVEADDSHGIVREMTTTSGATEDQISKRDVEATLGTNDDDDDKDNNNNNVEESTDTNKKTHMKVAADAPWKDRMWEVRTL
jgi:hypothetical protein